jgi:hypothetical protein
LLVPGVYQGKGTGSEPAEGWSIVHAAKDPWHRQFLHYNTQGAPKDQYYYAAYSDRELFLNLVDVPDPGWVQNIHLDTTVGFTSRQWINGRKVLIHCNHGTSRSPWLALHVMGCLLNFYEDLSWEEAEYAITSRIEDADPTSGMKARVRDLWPKK